MVVATLLCEERVSLERALNVVKSDNENLGKKDSLILELVVPKFETKVQICSSFNQVKKALGNSTFAFSYSTHRWP